MPAPVIDLRSDTMTRPTPAMKQAMMEAEVGDDMSGEDPTVNRLEAMCAELFGKEAAVFACSGTQSNQMAVWAHCQRGDELLIDATGHVSNFEAGAPAALAGVTCRSVTGRFGILDVGDLEGKIRPDNQHFCTTRLVCVENTTNLGGGRCYPIENLQRIGKWARDNGLALHMDGARLFNAVVAAGYSAKEVTAPVDTVSVCFSKGLGCPMGSILVGPKDVIYRARRARKLFGGALRQAGIVAAAAIYALENNIERLKVDHEHAQMLAQAIERIPGVKLDAAGVQTNLVFFEVEPSVCTASEFAARLKARGVLANPSGGRYRLRACTHLDISRADIERTIAVFEECVRPDAAIPADQVPESPYAR